MRNPIYNRVALALFAATLAAAPALTWADACTTPGIVIADDPTGDAQDMPVGGTPAPTILNSEDITQLAVAEPSNLSNRVVFTLKVVDLSILPPQERWVVYFSTYDKDGNPTEHYVAMSTANIDEGDTQAPSFEYGDTQVLDNPAAPVGQFVKKGDLDPASTFNADGTITLVLDPSVFGIGPGTLLDVIYSKVRRSSPEQTNNMGLTNDDTLASAGLYTLVGNSNCKSGKSGLLGLGALPLPGVLMLAGLAALRRRAR